MESMYSLVKTGRDTCLKEPLLPMYVTSSFVNLSGPKFLSLSLFLAIFCVDMDPRDVIIASFMFKAFVIIPFSYVHHVFLLSCHVTNIIYLVNECILYLLWLLFVCYCNLNNYWGIQLLQLVIPSWDYLHAYNGHWLPSPFTSNFGLGLLGFCLWVLSWATYVYFLVYLEAHCTFFVIYNITYQKKKKKNPS